ncbi:hypothetical protein [Neisseria elongata]|uniref:hypothetical protein n=1 Tax=Neisseria elongata TaxID=495 RepID=UPI003621D396
MACLSVPGRLNPPKQTDTAKPPNEKTAPALFRRPHSGKRPSENTTTIAFSDGLSAASAGH